MADVAGETVQAVSIEGEALMGGLAMKKFTSVLGMKLSSLRCASDVRDVSHQDEFEQIKREFISTAAHELRTPLTSILGFSQLLLNQEGYGVVEPNKQREFLGYINKKARTLMGIVDTLLDLDRLQSGQGIPLNRSFCTIGRMVFEARQALQKESENNRFMVILSEGTTKVWVDRIKMQQVLEALFSNALKFSPATLIRVRGERSGSSYHISVEDEGTGMTPEQVKKAFHPFYRADASNTATEGLGLGLSLARGIVEAHGGQIRVESELGQGTKVTIVIPCSNT